jgi:hypothetical protein
MSPNDRDPRARDDDELSDDALESVTGGVANTVSLTGTNSLGLGGTAGQPTAGIDRTLGTSGGDVAID